MIHVHDLVHIQPMGAIFWEKVDLLCLPPQYEVRVQDPIDLSDLKVGVVPEIEAYSS